jgi:hypothetical protein
MNTSTRSDAASVGNQSFNSNYSEPAEENDYDAIAENMSRARLTGQYDENSQGIFGKRSSSKPTKSE